MQKKIIALAVAGLMSGAAFAQSNVTISGLVDMGWSYRSDNRIAGVDSKSAIDSGIQSGNRIQFAGVEDIGGGNKVGFVLEQGFATDTGVFGANSGSGVGFGRQAYLYYAGGFGTVAAGRVYTPQFNLITSIDPFGTGTVGQINNVYKLGINQNGLVRADNTAAYISPSFGGLTVTVAYSNSFLGQEALDNTGDLRTFVVSPVYKNGPMMVGFNYHRVKANDVAGAEPYKVWDLGGTYDLGVAKLAGVYGQSKNDNNDNKWKNWMLGVTVPMGNGALLASYTSAKESLTDAKGRQAAVGYQYNLSKRSNLYFAYADISNDNGATFTVGDSSNAGENYQSGFNVGLRHKF